MGKIEIVGNAIPCKVSKPLWIKTGYKQKVDGTWQVALPAPYPSVSR